MTPKDQTERQKLKDELYRQSGLFQICLLLLFGWLATIRMALNSVEEMLLEHPRAYSPIDKLCVSLYALLGLVLTYYYCEFCLQVYREYKLMADNWDKKRWKKK